MYQITVNAWMWTVHIHNRYSLHTAHEWQTCACMNQINLIENHTHTHTYLRFCDLHYSSSNTVCAHCTPKGVIIVTIHSIHFQHHFLCAIFFRLSLLIKSSTVLSPMRISCSKSVMYIRQSHALARATMQSWIIWSVSACFLTLWFCNFNGFRSF